MGLFYEREVVPASGGIRIVELTAMSPVEGVPPRPEPGPTPPEPPVIGGGPIFPPEVTPPIVFPGLPPGHYPPNWPGTPVPPQPGQPTGGRIAYVSPPPAGTTPPTESAPDATWMLVVMERGSPPTWAKINPYASTGPITPPA